MVLVVVLVILMVRAMVVNMKMQMMVTDKTDDKRRETGPQTILMVTSIPWAIGHGQIQSPAFIHIKDAFWICAFVKLRFFVIKKERHSAEIL